jgi:hypothetical protein
MITNFFKMVPREPRPPTVRPPPARVVSMFDTHRLSLLPWTKRGYRGVHDLIDDLSAETLQSFAQRHRDVAFVYAAPPCADLSSAGARWWRAKRAEDPLFQQRACDGLKRLHATLTAMRVPFVLVLPRSGRVRRALAAGVEATPFSPHEYGGHLSSGAPHPLFPDIIPVSDAYSLRSLMVLGGGLRRPPHRPVRPVYRIVTTRSGRKKRVCPLLALRKHHRSRNTPPLGLLQAISDSNTGAHTRV